MKKENGFLVALDAGHGQDNRHEGVYDPGICFAGLQEADITLAYALTAKYVLTQAGIGVFLTRVSEEDPAPLGRRAGRAFSAGASVFVSFHVNGAETHVPCGVEAFFPGADRDNKHGAKLARRLAGWSALALDRPNRGAKPETATARGKLAVMAFPGHVALLEVGFLTNPFDRAKITTREARLAVADALLRSIRQEDPPEG